MSLYVVESHSFSIDHAGHTSEGVRGDYPGQEKIYLHVVALSDAEVRSLVPRVDENGNVEHARLALPRNEDFWVAVDGEASWPKVVRPKLFSKCDLSGPKPLPIPLAKEDADRLTKLGVKLPRA